MFWNTIWEDQVEGNQDLWQQYIIDKPDIQLLKLFHIRTTNFTTILLDKTCGKIYLVYDEKDRTGTWI